MRQTVAGGYVLTGEREVAFQMGQYDVSRPLVIDPVITYSTYLGESNDERHPLYGNPSSIAVDTAGNAYVAGVTTSLDFPTTVGTDRVLGSNLDAFVTKLSPAGAVLYSTYLGGPCEDHGRSIAVDTAGNAYVTGRAHDGVCFEAGLSGGVLVAKRSPIGTLGYFFTFGGNLADTSVGQAIIGWSLDRQRHERAYVCVVCSIRAHTMPVMATLPFGNQSGGRSSFGPSPHTDVYGRPETATARQGMMLGILGSKRTGIEFISTCFRPACDLFVTCFSTV